MVFEGDAPESLSKVVPFLGQGSDLIDELPGDSWLALAQPDLGKLLDFYVDAFGSSVGGRDVVEDQLRNATGLDLESDVLDWMGDFGLFVRGTSVSNLNGGLVVETTDPAATERFIVSLGRLARAQRRLRHDDRVRSPPRVGARASRFATTRCRSRSTSSCAVTAS